MEEDEGLFGEETEGTPPPNKLDHGEAQGEASSQADGAAELLSMGTPVSLWGHLCHYLSSWGVQQLHTQQPKHLEGAFPKVPQELGKLLRLCTQVRTGRCKTRGQALTWLCPSS